MALLLDERALEGADAVANDRAVGDRPDPAVGARAEERAPSQRALASEAALARPEVTGDHPLHDRRTVDALTELRDSGLSEVDQRQLLADYVRGLPADDGAAYQSFAYCVMVVYLPNGAFLEQIFQDLSDHLAADDRLVALASSVKWIGDLVIAFVEGVLAGLEEAGWLDAEQYQRLLEMHLESLLYLNLFHPIVASAGSTVGILEDAVGTVAGAFYLTGEAIDELLSLTGLTEGELIAAFQEMFFKVLGDEGVGYARELGHEFAGGLQEGVEVLVGEQRVIPFTFQLFRLLGPLALQIVLTFTGAGNALKTVYVTRLFGKLERILPDRLVKGAKTAARKATNKLRSRVDSFLASLGDDSPEYRGWLDLQDVARELGDDSLVDDFAVRFACRLGEVGG